MGFRNHAEEIEHAMKAAVFEVTLHQKSNNLNAMVQVVALTESDAKRLVLNTFFKTSWEVTGCKVIRQWRNG